MCGMVSLVVISSGSGIMTNAMNFSNFMAREPLSSIDL